MFVTGKGGVGKTTVAAALALAAAEADGGAVFVEFGDGAGAKRTLAGRTDAVEHIVIRPRRAVMQAAESMFGSKALARIALDNFAARPVIRAAPAIREVAILELARQVVKAHPGRRVVFDMPATGHSVAWLKVARQGRDLTKRGPIHELCVRLEDELVRPGRASVVVVTLPERLVLAETLLLCRAIEGEVGLPVDRVIVNRIPQPSPPTALADARRLSTEPGAVGQAATQLAELLTIRETIRAQVLEALDATVHHGGEDSLTLLPLAPSDPTASTVAGWLRDAGAA